MPSSLDELKLEDQIGLADADPELHALLSGTAVAELEMAALNGTLPDVATSPEQRQSAENAARVEQLIADGAFPTPGSYDAAGNYQPGREGNLTSQMLVAQLDPQRYEAEMAKARPAAAPASEAELRDRQIFANYGIQTAPTPAGVS